MSGNRCPLMSRNGLAVMLGKPRQDRPTPRHGIVGAEAFTEAVLQFLERTRVGISMAKERVLNKG